MVRHKETDRTQVMSETRQLLLTAAAQEFAEQGYDRANVNRIANAAGFSIGTVYNYFPSKRELMQAFIDEVSKLHVEFIVGRVTQKRDPGRRLQVFFEAGFDFVSIHLTQSRAIFNVLNGADEAFRLRLFQAYRPLFQLLSEEILKPGIEQNLFRPVDPGSTAGLLMLIYLGTSSQFSPDGKHWLESSVVADFTVHALRA